MGILAVSSVCLRQSYREYPSNTCPMIPVINPPGDSHTAALATASPCCEEDVCVLNHESAGLFTLVQDFIKRHLPQESNSTRVHADWVWGYLWGSEKSTFTYELGEASRLFQDTAKRIPTPMAFICSFSILKR